MSRLSQTLLKNTRAYILLQQLIGADKLRYHCIDLLAPKPGDRVLDVGCGPAYYVDHLPEVEYFGFDTDATYIEFAKKHFGHRAKFECALFSERHVAELPAIDGVLLMGLLHHLDDTVASDLLRLLGKTMAPGGRAITLDACFHDGQSRFRHFIAASDRGQHVRRPEEFTELAARHFDRVDGELVTDVCRVPSSYWLMTLSKPHTNG